MLGTGKLDGFGYGIGVSIGVLLLITTITLTSYFCTRTTTPPPPPPQPLSARAHYDPSSTDIETAFSGGVDEEVLKSYPKLMYSQAKKEYSTMDSCCSVCLGDYKDSDLLRVLPDCGHLFHVKCVDSWLRLRPSCPICRRCSPLPSPLSTPLAQVVPLARISIHAS
ncbi:RING-H2 finger protein ATL70 [Acorus gramineus]|uniref:RING-H2 finger protein ATL70 n=1 Tax=Acorus gramineus TaxID=55184 RepID=A0AAV9AIK6_ACOGR|nr:RING-H2 finger protein ATL70 [Acorus gramineus]